MDYYDVRERTLELRTTFTDCEFSDNQYFGTPATTAIAVGSTRQNRIVVSRSIFANNDMTHNNTLADKSSFLIETSGPITVTGSCFESNQVGVSPVVTYGVNEHIFVDNYGDSSNGGLCALGARFETTVQLEANVPLCTQFDGATCEARSTRPPTLSPTSMPTGGFPTTSPSSSPTSFPTVTPAPSILEPTLLPTTLEPTSAPFMEPTSAPFIVPSSAAVLKAPSGLLLMSAAFLLFFTGLACKQ